MIDWPALGFSALWVLGLSLALAAFSLAEFLAGRQNLRLSAALNLPFCRAMLDGGVLLFGAGWALSAASPLERGLWLGVSLLFAARLLVGWVAWK